MRGQEQGAPGGSECHRPSSVFGPAAPPKPPQEAGGNPVVDDGAWRGESAWMGGSLSLSTVMWLLLACVTETEKPSGGDPPFADSGDTGDTGDTGGRPDSGNANERCAEPPAEHPLTVGDWASSWGVGVFADLDGGGAPDLLHQAQGPDGVALVRGEDAAFGDTSHAVLLPATLGSAGFLVGVPGDVDGDGQADVAVGEVSARDERALTVWSLAAEAHWSVMLADANNASPSVSRGGPVDTDGDGLAEVAVAADTSLWLFEGLGPGAHTVDDAVLVVTSGAGSGYGPYSPGDLDGDGLGDLVVTTGVDLERDDIVLLSGDLAARGGALDSDDLDVLVTMPGFTREPLFVDLDADGLAELFVQDWIYQQSFAVLGFSGGAVASAATSGVTLSEAEAFVTLEGDGYDYLGGNFAPITDGDCLPGVAASAHFGERVYLFANADLRGGGTLAAADTAALGGDSEWFGYVLAGGQDIDRDGTFDLVVGNSAGDLSLLLSPWDLAFVP